VNHDEAYDTGWDHGFVAGYETSTKEAQSPEPSKGPDADELRIQVEALREAKRELSRAALGYVAERDYYKNLYLNSPNPPNPPVQWPSLGEISDTLKRIFSSTKGSND
jgi:hypothetical protein